MTTSGDVMASRPHFSEMRPRPPAADDAHHRLHNSDGAFSRSSADLTTPAKQRGAREIGRAFPVVPPRRIDRGGSNACRPRGPQHPERITFHLSSWLPPYRLAYSSVRCTGDRDPWLRARPEHEVRTCAPDLRIHRAASGIRTPRPAATYAMPPRTD